MAEWGDVQGWAVLDSVCEPGLQAPWEVLHGDRELAKMRCGLEPTRQGPCRLSRPQELPPGPLPLCSSDSWGDWVRG